MSVSELQLHGSFLSCKHAFHHAEVWVLFIALFWVAQHGVPDLFLSLTFLVASVSSCILLPLAP